MEPKWHGVMKLEVHVLKNKTQHVFGCHAFIEHMCHRFNAAEPLLERRDHAILRPGHELYNESSGLLHGSFLVRIYKNAKPDRRWNLLRLCEVISKVLRNLTGHEINVADIRLLHTCVFDDAECALADCAADIEMSVFTKRQYDIRIGYKALHVTVGIRSGSKTCHRAIPLYRERDGVIGAF